MAARLRTLVRQVESTLVEKRSRFITRAAPVATEEEARAFIAAVSEPKASHNCYAYRLDAQTFRYSDDGEPSGTAGAPIFAALSGAGVDAVYLCVVVTRYFGGIKLGTGGLTRTYGRAAQECLAAAEWADYVPTVVASVVVGFDHVSSAFRVAQHYHRLQAANSATGCELRIRVPQHHQQKFVDEMRNATKGAAIVTFVNEQ